MPIMGTCPYTDCGGDLWLTFDEEDPRLPAYGKTDCETCHRPIWHHYSRLDPWSMAEADFLTQFEIDEEHKRIKRKPLITQ